MARLPPTLRRAQGERIGSSSPQIPPVVAPENSMKISSEPKLTADSYYEASVTRPLSRGALMSELAADVCVVGGGLAGLSAAIELRQRGYSVVVLEAKHIGWGASGRNGGQAIAGLACDISVIEKQLGTEAAKRVWDMTLEAIDLIHERRAAFKIH